MTPFALPGEKVRVRPLRGYKGHEQAEVLEVLERSPERVEPDCPYFAKCGGCNYQHAPYAFQVAQKEAIVREVFRRVGKFEAPEKIEVLTGEPWNYRTRSQFRYDGREIGYLAAASHKLVPVEKCPISAPQVNEALAVLRRLMRDRRFPRFLRTFELFTNGSEVMLDVIETDEGRHMAKGFFDWCAQKIPGASKGSLDCKAAGETFRVSHGSFFQVNRFLTDRLVETALAGAEGETALDLYAGVGLFTLPLARKFRNVNAVELTNSAFRDLEYNAAEATLRIGTHRAMADQYLETLNKPPDFVLADPPRSGLGKVAVQHLVRLRPPRLTVVACDPATLARDLAGLFEGGYRLAQLTLLDLFPQTYHIEIVARLELQPTPSA